MSKCKEEICLCVDQFVEDDFLRKVFDVVHGGDRSHLIVGFEGFRDAFTLSHLCGETLHHFVGLPVDLLQMGVQGGKSILS